MVDHVKMPQRLSLVSKEFLHTGWGSCLPGKIGMRSLIGLPNIHIVSPYLVYLGIVKSLFEIYPRLEYL